MPRRFFAFMGVFWIAAAAWPAFSKTPAKKSGKLFERHVVEGAGVSIDFYVPWKVESYIEDKGGNVIQRIDGDKGLVFVRYGRNAYDQEETVDTFLSWLTDLITTITIKKDEKIMFHGRSARRVLLEQNRQGLHVMIKNAQGQLVCKEEPAEKRRILVIGFEHNDTHVLLSYRILSEHFSEHKPVLKKIMKSVKLEKD